MPLQFVKDLFWPGAPQGSTAHGEIEVDPSPEAHKILCRSRHLAVVEDRVRFPDGSYGEFYRVMRPQRSGELAGAAVVPVRFLPEPEVGLVIQWRHARNGWMAEVPRGALENDEVPHLGALRELAEETGLPAPDMFVSLGEIASDSGLTPDKLAIFLAAYDGVPQHRPVSLDDTEAIAGLAWVPLNQVIAYLGVAPLADRPYGGVDSFTLAGLALLHSTGLVDELQNCADASRGPSRAAPIHVRTRGEAAEAMMRRFPFADRLVPGLYRFANASPLLLRWLDQRSDMYNDE
jgi:8-oxo-dGTP pyrophosphatase MutT (NUDIX family)